MLRHITIEDGLPSNNVYSVVEDSKGFLWFATDDGIVKYDGQSMKVFTTADGLPKNDIFDLREDSRGRMWLMSQSKQLVYIKNDSIFLTYTKEDKHYVHDFGENEKGIYFLQGTTLFQESNGSISKVVLKQKTIEDESSFFLWRNLGKDTFYFQKYDDCTLVHETEKILLRGCASLMMYHTYIYDSFLAFYDLGSESIYIYNSETNKVTDLIVLPVSERKNFITKLRASAHGYDYVTNGRLYKVKARSPEFEMLNFDAFKYCDFPTSFVERNGLMVLSTLDKGVFFFRKNLPAQNNYLLLGEITSYDIINDSLLVLGDKKGSLYVVDSILQIKQANINESFEKNPEIRRIQVDESSGELYYLSNSESIALLSDLKQLNETRGIKIGDASKFGHRDFILFDNKTFIIRTASSIRTIDKQSNKMQFIINSQANDFKLSQNKEDLYVGTNKRLITHNILNASDDTISVDYNIRGIAEVDRNLFLGTDGQGIYVIDLNTKISTNILANKSITNLSATEKFVIASSPKGVVVFDKEYPFNIKHYFRKSEGLLSNEVKFATTFQDKFLFITREGIQLMDTAQVQKQYDISVYIDHKELSYHDTLILSDSREFSFQVKKVDYVNYPIDYHVSFTDGKDDYSLTSNENMSYRNLKPGTYELKIYGQNRDYNFKTNIITKTIIIPAKLYETLAFKITIGFLLIGGFYLILQNRFKKQRAETIEKLELEKEYASIELQALQSQLNPHFVFNCLGSIQALISVNNNKDANSYLTKFSRLMRKFLEQSTIHTTTLAEEIEINRMYLDLEKLRFKEKLNYQINTDPSLDVKKIMIPAVLLQPYVENAIRHGLFHKAEDGNVAMNFKRQSRDLIIEIVDDGVGVDAANEINRASRFHHESKGSELMQRKTALMSIVEELDFTIEIIDRKLQENTSGTMVRITFPEILSIVS